MEKLEGKKEKKKPYRTQKKPTKISPQQNHIQSAIYNIYFHYVSEANIYL